MEEGEGDLAGKAMDVVQDHLLTPSIDTYGVSDILGLQTLVMNAVFTDGESLCAAGCVTLASTRT